MAYLVEPLQSPADAVYWLLTGRTLFSFIHLLGLACFAFILAKRIVPLRSAQSDPRFDRPWRRIGNVLRFWLAQWRQPRYPGAGILHILIFAGFLILAIRSLTLIAQGTFDNFVLPGFAGALGELYAVIKDYASTLVLVCVVVAGIRRALFKPARYAVPPQYGKDHTGEALLVLGLIGMLMVSESLFGASSAMLTATQRTGSEMPAPLSLAWVFGLALSGASHSALLTVYRAAYLVHDLTFFSFLCFLPMGKHFHVITSLFNVYFSKLDRGAIKPVRWALSEGALDQVKSLGVKQFEDFTWKHILDFYSCADCGRCSDNCPAHAAGRPLSPRFLTIKARQYAFEHYPFAAASNHQPLVGSLYSEDEIWSCTTCGACEQECPLLIEYIDKIVDLRRGLVDDGKVPQSIQKALRALESRGNPYGKVQKKRADWARAPQFATTCKVRTLDGANTAETLYFVDSITSYDDRIQSIGGATARILDAIGKNFAILGAAEKDSGHDVRRFGEETLFMALRDENLEAIRSTGAKRIVTSDPHAFNALRHDYGKDLPPVEHISQVIAREVRSGTLKLKAVADTDKVYTYHDPCYLGRHNNVYDDPREVLDAIPGLKRVEMNRCGDRSFCCGGGGLMLFYEPKEDQRMGVLRVNMAAEAGANVIVTACPFCMVNLEDAIKVAGLEGKMEAIDLAELVDRHLMRADSGAHREVPAGELVKST
jgi:Fe-S oxidoreductase